MIIQKVTIDFFLEEEEEEERKENREKELYEVTYFLVDTMKILIKECPPDEDSNFYLNFIELIYAIFHNPCNDINELRYISSLMFPKYREPVIQGECEF